MPATPPPKSFTMKNNWLVNVLLLMFFLGLFYLLTGRPDSQEQSYRIAYSEFLRLVNEGKVVSLTLEGREAEGRLLEAENIGPKREYGMRFRTRIPDMADSTLLALLEEHKVELTVSAGQTSSIVWQLVISFLPWILIIGLWIWLIRRAQRNITGGLGGGGELGKFLQGSAKTAEIPDVTFDDMAGQDTAKRPVIHQKQVPVHREWYDLDLYPGARDHTRNITRFDIENVDSRVETSADRLIQPWVPVGEPVIIVFRIRDIPAVSVIDLPHPVKNLRRFPHERELDSRRDVYRCGCPIHAIESGGSKHLAHDR